MELEEIRSLMREFVDLRLGSMEMQRDGVILRLKESELFSDQTHSTNETLNFFKEDTAISERTSSSVNEVRSPLVGTAYIAPSPDADPYVIVGQRVEKGAILCLIEAMKMMNEVTAPVAGVVRSVCFQNGQLVSFNQALVELEEV